MPTMPTDRVARYTAARDRLAAREYIIVAGDAEYSADAADYWDAVDDTYLGGALVSRNHPYRTVTGLTVYAPRGLKSRATVRDIRRLARAAGLEGN
jgi:hypothetical protein